MLDASEQHVLLHKTGKGNRFNDWDLASYLALGGGGGGVETHDSGSKGVGFL